MIIKITDADASIRYVSGPYEQCMANVNEGDTYEEIEEMPCTFTYDTMSIARHEIKHMRDASFTLGFTYSVDAKDYPCDTVFQEAIKTYLTAYTSGVLTEDNTVRIRRNDNTFWYPNYAELKPFAAELMNHINNIWTVYWQEKDAL